MADTVSNNENLLRFLHLSDIHFTYHDGASDTDVDSAVRARMLEDIHAMQVQLGDMHAILVVGDIAASGKRADYDVAASFLDRTCEMVAVAAEQVVCVPGNHDIDRDLQDALHGAVRFQLRRVEALKISGVLLKLLQQEAGSRTLLRPLKEYNRFAFRYGCSISHESLLWKPKTLRLGDRNVHIHGVTSAWVCDESDSFESDSRRVVVGEFQLPAIANDSSAISIALCHHPLRWLRDADLVKPWLARAQVVLTGHEHEAGIAESDDSRSLRIASGAVNPNKAHREWLPAYNIIDLELTDKNRLLVRVFSRSWKGDVAEFGPDPSRPQPYSCQLRLTPSPAESDFAESTTLDKEHPLPGGSAIAVPEPEQLVSDERKRVYHVMSASPDVRRGVARELGLLPQDEGLGGLELDKEILRRALDQRQLAELDMRIGNG